MRRAILLFVLFLVLPACGGGGTTPTPMPDPDTDTDFVAFVKARFAETADDTDPVPVNDVVFENQFIDDESAFDDLLP